MIGTADQLQQEVAEVLGGQRGPAAAELPTEVRRQAALAALARRTPAEQACDVLRDGASLLAESLDMDQCGAALYQAGGGTLSLWLGPSSAGRNDESGVEVSLLAGSGRTVINLALSAPHPVVAFDLERDPRFTDSFLLNHGIRSAVACAVTHEQETFGVLGAFSTTTRTFAPDEVLLAASIANLLAVTLSEQHAQQALQAEVDARAKMIEGIGTMALELTLDGRIEHVNAACEQAVGLGEQDLRGRPLWSALLIPEELELLKETFGRLKRGEGPLQFEGSILTREGDRRRMAWTFSRLPLPSQRGAEVLATAVDLTEQRRLADELAQAISTRDLEASQRREGASPFQQLPEGEFDDRRQRRRRAYPYRQKIAPITHGKLPEPDQFYEVQCKDISARGFAYLWPEVPTEKTILVAFGAEPSVIHIVAKVVHTTSIRVSGRPMQLVGCMYVRRVQYAAAEGLRSKA